MGRARDAMGSRGEAAEATPAAARALACKFCGSEEAKRAGARSHRQYCRGKYRRFYVRWPCPLFAPARPVLEKSFMCIGRGLEATFHKIHLVIDQRENNMGMAKLIHQSIVSVPS
jgi:hypothetical protein